MQSAKKNSSRQRASTMACALLCFLAMALSDGSAVVMSSSIRKGSQDYLAASGASEPTNKGEVSKGKKALEPFSEKKAARRISAKLKHLEDKETKWLEDVDRDDLTEVECHKVAVWRCGHIFIRVFKFLDYLPAAEAFQPRCALRNAFFTCLKVSRQNSCVHKKRSNNNERFRKRLADNLWSTRTCLMGVRPSQ